MMQDPLDKKVRDDIKSKLMGMGIGAAPIPGAAGAALKVAAAEAMKKQQEAAKAAMQKEDEAKKTEEKQEGFWSKLKKGAAKAGKAAGALGKGAIAVGAAGAGAGYAWASRAGKPPRDTNQKISSGPHPIRTQAFWLALMFIITILLHIYVNVWATSNASLLSLKITLLFVLTIIMWLLIYLDIANVQGLALCFAISAGFFFMPELLHWLLSVVPIIPQIYIDLVIVFVPLWPWAIALYFNQNLPGGSSKFINAVSLIFFFVLVILLVFPTVDLVNSSVLGQPAVFGLVGKGVDVPKVKDTVLTSVKKIIKAARNFFPSLNKAYQEQLFYATHGYLPGEVAGAEKTNVIELYAPASVKKEYEPPEAVSIDAIFKAYGVKGIDVRFSCESVSSKGETKKQKIMDVDQAEPRDTLKLVNFEQGKTINCYLGTNLAKGDNKVKIYATGQKFLTAARLKNYFTSEDRYKAVTEKIMGQDPEISSDMFYSKIKDEFDIDTNPISLSSNGPVKLILHTTDSPIEGIDPAKKKYVSLTVAVEQLYPGEITKMGEGDLKIYLPEGMAIADPASDIPTCPAFKKGERDNILLFVPDNLANTGDLAAKPGENTLESKPSAANSNIRAIFNFSILKQVPLPTCHLIIKDSSKILTSPNTANSITITATMQYDYEVVQEYDVRYGTESIGDGGVVGLTGGSKCKLTNTDAINKNELEKYVNNNAPSDSIFKGKGGEIYDASVRAGINPAFMLALAIHEGSWGTSDVAKCKFNTFGWGAQDSCTNQCSDEINCAKRYASVESSFYDVAKNIYNRWLSQNPELPPQRKSLDEMSGSTPISKTWQVYATDPNWPNAMAGVMSKILNIECSATSTGDEVLTGETVQLSNGEMAGLINGKWTKGIGESTASPWLGTFDVSMLVPYDKCYYDPENLPSCTQCVMLPKTRECVQRLKQLAQENGLSLTVTCAYSPTTGHTGNSRHYTGQAVDFDISGVSKSDAATLAEKTNCFTYVYYEDESHIHASVGAS